MKKKDLRCKTRAIVRQILTKDTLHFDIGIFWRKTGSFFAIYSGASEEKKQTKDASASAKVVNLGKVSAVIACLKRSHRQLRGRLTAETPFLLFHLKIPLAAMKVFAKL